MIERPVQKTLLIPSGFSVTHDDSPPGTCGCVVTTSREYLLLHASTICPTASVTISGFSLQDPDEDAVDEPDEHAEADAARGSPRARRVVRARLDADDQVPAERDDARGREVDAGVHDRRASGRAPRSARTVMYGRTNAHEVRLERVRRGDRGRRSTSTPVASQIGRKRAATTALDGERVDATRRRAPGVTRSRSRGGGRMKGWPRPRRPFSTRGRGEQCQLMAWNACDRRTWHAIDGTRGARRAERLCSLYMRRRGRVSASAGGADSMSRRG